MTDIEAGDYGANDQAPAGDESGEVALAPVQKRAVGGDLAEASFEVAQAGE
ncbi:hypothetical protein D3C83_266030 [compost metagenome]